MISENLLMVYNRAPQPLGCGSLLGHGIFGIGLHEWLAGVCAGAAQLARAAGQQALTRARAVSARAAQFHPPRLPSWKDWRLLVYNKSQNYLS